MTKPNRYPNMNHNTTLSQAFYEHILPIWQAAPVNMAGQLHVKVSPSAESSQVPPLVQGLLSQGSTGEKTNRSHILQLFE